jgi:hypothetical protein
MSKRNCCNCAGSGDEDDEDGVAEQEDAECDGDDADAAAADDDDEEEEEEEEVDDDDDDDDDNKKDAVRRFVDDAAIRDKDELDYTDDVPRQRRRVAAIAQESVRVYCCAHATSCNARGSQKAAAATAQRKAEHFNQWGYCRVVDSERAKLRRRLTRADAAVQAARVEAVRAESALAAPLATQIRTETQQALGLEGLGFLQRLAHEHLEEPLAISVLAQRVVDQQLPGASRTLSEDVASAPVPSDAVAAAIAPVPCLPADVPPDGLVLAAAHADAQPLCYARRPACALELLLLHCEEYRGGLRAFLASVCSSGGPPPQSPDCLVGDMFFHAMDACVPTERVPSAQAKGASAVAGDLDFCEAVSADAQAPLEFSRNLSSMGCATIPRGHHLRGAAVLYAVQSSCGPAFTVAPTTVGAQSMTDRRWWSSLRAALDPLPTDGSIVRSFAFEGDNAYVGFRALVLSQTYTWQYLAARTSGTASDVQPALSSLIFTVQCAAARFLTVMGLTESSCQADRDPGSILAGRAASLAHPATSATTALGSAHLLDSDMYVTSVRPSAVSISRSNAE